MTIGPTQDKTERKEGDRAEGGCNAEGTQAWLHIIMLCPLHFCSLLSHSCLALKPWRCFFPLSLSPNSPAVRSLPIPYHHRHRLSPLVPRIVHCSRAPEGLLAWRHPRAASSRYCQSPHSSLLSCTRFCPAFPTRTWTIFYDFLILENSLLPAVVSAPRPYSTAIFNQLKFFCSRF
jgi:hypothetical protein